MITFMFKCLIDMCKDEKLSFIDKIVSCFERYCPQMSSDVRYWVACQFALESNFGKSRLARVQNNYCGMKIPSVRITLNNRVSSVGFAAFDSLDSCVIDYVYWLAYNKFNSYDLFNLELYSRRLIASKYCPEKDYIDSIYSLFNSLKSN